MQSWTSYKLMTEQIVALMACVRVDSLFHLSVTCAHHYSRRTRALDTPSRYWLTHLFLRYNH
ncbi:MULTISPECIES: YsgD/CorL family protein [Lonsdalea]|uniref:YsgD/CorL family protein n=1 Tax=Lonsdalea TaxID=1082702 RepID=UPI0034A0C6D4